MNTCTCTWILAGECLKKRSYLHSYMYIITCTCTCNYIDSTTCGQ